MNLSRADPWTVPQLRPSSPNGRPPARSTTDPRFRLLPCQRRHRPRASSLRSGLKDSFADNAFRVNEPLACLAAGRLTHGVGDLAREIRYGFRGTYQRCRKYCPDDDGAEKARARDSDA